MLGTISFLKKLYVGNKKLFIITLLVIAVFVIVGCTTGTSIEPSNQYVGGGCG